MQDKQGDDQNNNNNNESHNNHASHNDHHVKHQPHYHHHNLMHHHHATKNQQQHQFKQTPLSITLNPKDWKYKSEGIGNIVLSYCGNQPSLRGMVLRVRKGMEHEQAVFDENSDHKQVFVHLYMKHIVQRVIGPTLVYAAVRCYLQYKKKSFQ